VKEVIYFDEPPPLKLPGDRSATYKKANLDKLLQFNFLRILMFVFSPWFKAGFIKLRKRILELLSQNYSFVQVGIV
jgi:hypothetical protein